jgi:hypothetical protein
MLLLCTTGKAHSYLLNWIKLGDDVPTLYHNIMSQFDTRVSAEEAQNNLFTYRAPKSTNLRHMEAKIMEWAERASSNIPNGPGRKDFYNMQVVQAMIRALPPTSASRVQSVYNTLSARMGRAALATELSRALNLDRHAIDLDIKANGGEGIRVSRLNNMVKRRPIRIQAYSVQASNRREYTPMVMNVGAVPRANQISGRQNSQSMIREYPQRTSYPNRFNRASGSMMNRNRSFSSNRMTYQNRSPFNARQNNFSGNKQTYMNQ